MKNKKSDKHYKPLSEGQKSLWFSHICFSDIGVYNNRFAWYIPESVDEQLLIKTLDVVCNHHEALRSTYVEIDGEPRQEVHERLDFGLDYCHLDTDSEEDLLKALDEEIRVKQKLDKVSSLRWKLYSQPSGKRILLMLVNHINLDQWSVVTLINQLQLVYGQLATGKEIELPEPENTFDTYLKEQNEYTDSIEGQKEVDFWQDELWGMESNLNLPIDYHRGENSTCQLGYVCQNIPLKLTEKFHQKVTDIEGSLFSFYLGLYHLLLSKYCQQEDITITTPTGGRDDQYKGLFNYFVNPIASRARLQPDISLEAFLNEFNAQTLERLKRSRVPFPCIINKYRESFEIDGSLFQAGFFLHNINRFENRENPLVSWTPEGKRTWHMGAAGEWEHIAQAQQLDDFDITFKIYKLKENMFVGIEYNSDLFKHESIERMAKHYQVLMQTVIENPDIEIGKISLLTQEETIQLRDKWNQTQCYYNPNKSLPDYVAKYAKSSPDAPAVVYQHRSVSYSELNEKSNQIANYLRAEGVEDEAIIGVYLKRSPDLIAALVGILKAGAVYLPLDPDYPSDRIELILEDSKPDLIFCEENSQAKFAEWSSSIKTVDIGVEDITAASKKDPQISQNADQLAYVIYTSGTTGKPKGVMLKHRGISSLCEAKNPLVDVTSDDALLQFASCNFDGSIFEIVTALKAGAKLVMADKSQLMGRNLVDLCRKNKVTWAVIPPALLSTLAPKDFPDIRILGSAGDALTKDLITQWSEGRTLINGYGPTESTVWATTSVLKPGADAVIGKPVPNTQVYILSPSLQLQPVGIPGELHIGGDGLARGYLNRPDLTAEKFIPNPFSEDKNAKLYKTGDLCRYLSDGNIEFLGRIDHQVKIRGFRVELGEIESVLREYPGVHDVLVMAREDFEGQTTPQKQLAAYIVKNASENLDVAEIREFLKSRLPDYMVPAATILLDAFPLTPNKKVDRKALPVPNLAEGRQASHKPPRNEIERIVAKVWQEVLGVKDISVSENFFDLGGHSLLLAQVHSQLPEQLRENLSMVDMFKYPTIQALAHFLEGDEEEDGFFVDHDHHAERLRLRRRLMENLGGVKIAIVGMAGRFPGADTVEELWQNICDKKEGITFFTPEQLKQAGVPEELIKDPSYVPAKGMLDSVSRFEAPFFGFTPREAQITDPQQRLFLECAWESLEDAGCVPSDFDGRIGVYAGIGMNQYLMTHLSSRQDLIDSVGDYPLMIGNDKDFLSTRVSYKLNLDGPAMVLQTACSSSLVAVHTACQALLSQDCDAALAGGVSFGRLGKTGYQYQKGMIMSEDGHCRAFDEDASGTIQGQGAGVVLLKRLDDALENNDHIYAIISGSATNNDGSNKTGYTAPSVEGQAKAINMAQASANVRPEQISYIEAHGTGTPIGDPIEIEALRQAFQKPVNERLGKQNDIPAGSCAIGSVKTNIGHLDAASGIVGLIKTAKALEAKMLPPTLHYQKPNPKIDFDSTPFYVNTELKPWPSDNIPRYAGVSSFGIGGSNAHVVLMEPPNETPTTTARPWRILTLSARTPTALEAMTERFVHYLKTNKQHRFANICYTLHVGRTDFEYRRFLVCRNRDEAISELSPVNPANVVTSKFVERPRKVVFMFSGQGSQYKNMGKYLYQVELTFRQAIDECRALLAKKFMFIYEELAPEDYYGFSDKIHQTYITQPALFTFEYAMAKMLMSWGIKPDLMLGHSIGEYVAACLAGVFTLEEAIDLVAIRGQLIQGLEDKGEMLSVNLPEAEAQALTNHDVSLAAVNGERRCVLSGSQKGIQYLHLQLEKQGIESRILHTSHAFHSHMMDSVLDRFKGYVARRKPKAPTMPFISTRSGELITDEEAMSADYWAGHLRDTVQFHKAVQTVFDTRQQSGDQEEGRQVVLDDAFVFLEIGPGKVLTTLTRQHPGKAAQDWVLSTTRHAYEEVSDTEHLLKVVARLWEQGIDIDWDTFHSHRQRYRVPLPTYPFERKKHWIRPQSVVYQPVDTEALENNELEESYGQEENPLVAADAPRSPVEKKVCAIWKASLGLEALGIYEDFFDLGGDSLLAVNLLDQLQKAFSVPLASHILIQKPTVAALSEYILNNLSEEDGRIQGEETSEESSLVIIQQGEGRRKAGESADGRLLPLIMVHPIGGEVFFYRDLGRYLGKNQPLYAFQAASLSGNANPISSVKELASKYIAELKANEVMPPYLLGGSSFGGLVAYEMSQQLTAAGEEVRLLVMVDTPAPEQMPRNLSDSAAILQYLLEDKIDLSLESLRALDDSAQINYVLEQARVQGKGSMLPPHLGVPLFKTWMAHQEATVAYEPRSYHGDVLFFRHTESMKHFPALPHRPWQQLVRGNFYLHQIAGTHITMNYPPHVKSLSSHLKPYLDKASSPVSEDEVMTDRVYDPRGKIAS